MAQNSAMSPATSEPRQIYEQIINVLPKQPYNFIESCTLTKEHS
jgi:hypothetical protein